MKIIDRPTTYREYYSSFHEAYIEKCDKVQKELDRIESVLKDTKERIEKKRYLFKSKLDTDITLIPEFIATQYINGEFDKMSKAALMRYSNDYKFKVDILLLYKFANYLNYKKLREKELTTMQRCRNLTISEYKELLQRYFTEVHKYIILDGAGYQISPTVGVICFNRCKLKNARPKIDFNLTRINKKKMLEAGEHLFNKEEKEFCDINGIDYKGKDYRVFMNKDYVYEMPLLFGKFKNARESKFYISDYRSRKVRGKTNAQLIEECHNNTKEIVELPLDIRTKLTMCLSVDKMLYSKFIRNENQTPIATTKAYR